MAAMNQNMMGQISVLPGMRVGLPGMGGAGAAAGGSGLPQQTPSAAASAALEAALSGTALGGTTYGANGIVGVGGGMGMGGQVRVKRADWVEWGCLF